MSTLQARTREALLTRVATSDQGTQGVLSFGEQSLRTMELPWRGNQRKISCIPPGTYRCVMVRSPRFGRVYGLLDVPGRSHVLIHSANFAGDKTAGFDTQLEGCIAPCRSFGMLRNSKGKLQRAGILSRAALTVFMTWAAGQPFDLTVEGTL